MLDKPRDVIDLEMSKKILGINGYLDIRIVSSSMDPLIKKGEVIRVYTVDKRLEKYDIIIFLRNNKLVAHYIWRISGVKNISYVTRSIENPREDELPVRNEDILGIVKDIKISILRRLLMRLVYGQ